MGAAATSSPTQHEHQGDPREHDPGHDAVGSQEAFESFQVRSDQVTHAEQEPVPERGGDRSQDHHATKIDSSHPRRHEKQTADRGDEAVEEDEDVALPSPVLFYFFDLL